MLGGTNTPATAPVDVGAYHCKENPSTDMEKKATNNVYSGIVGSCKAQCNNCYSWIERTYYEAGSTKYLCNVYQTFLTFFTGDTMGSIGRYCERSML